MAKFEIYRDTEGEYRFRLKASNGQIILTSEGYKAKSGCLNGIDSVRKNSEDDGNYQRRESKNAGVYFNLKALNNQVIGTSQIYTTRVAMEIGINSVKKNAQVAEIMDLT